MSKLVSINLQHLPPSDEFQLDEGDYRVLANELKQLKANDGIKQTLLGTSMKKLKPYRMVYGTILFRKINARPLFLFKLLFINELMHRKHM